MAPPSLDLRQLPRDPGVDPEARYRQKDPHYLRHLLASVNPGPQVTVDADQDGYVDSHWLTALHDIRKGFSLQNELYRRGYISWVRPSELPNRMPVSEPVFDYLNIERLESGEVRVFAYFDSPDELDAFKRQLGCPDLPFDTIRAAKIERRPGMLRDVVDPDQDLPKGFARNIDDINRPIHGNSRTGRYFRVDVTELIHLPENILDQLNRPGTENSNCANLALVAAGLEDEFQYVDGPDSLVPRLGDPAQFTPAAQGARGDIVVWYKLKEDAKVFLHAFIDLGNGWVLTKNGAAEDNPVRFQRLETLRYLYEQEANRAQIYVAYYVPKWVMNPDHYGWQKDGGEEPPPFRPLVEERYRPSKNLNL